MDDEYLEIFWA